MNYLLLACAVLLSVANNAFLHRFKNEGLDNAGDTMLFNGGTQVSWVVLLFLLCTFTNSLRFDGTTILFGTFYGVLLCLFQVIKMAAYSSGPVALTTLIGTCAFIVTTAYTVIFDGEDISVPYLCGIAVLLLSLSLCIAPQKNAGSMKISPKWLMWSFLMFLTGGALGIFYRVFGSSSVSHNMNSMMLYAAALSAVILIAISFIINRTKNDPLPKIRGNAFKYMLINGVTSCIYIRLNLSLANLLPGTLFFPVSNGSILILATLVGILFFKENPSKRQLTGIIIGLAAIAVIGIVR